MGAGLAITNLLEMTYNDFFTLKNVTCEGLIAGMRRCTAQLTPLSRSTGLAKCPGMGREGHRAPRLKPLWVCGGFFSPRFFAGPFAQDPSLFSPENTAYAVLFGSLLGICA